MKKLSSSKVIGFLASKALIKKIDALSKRNGDANRSHTLRNIVNSYFPKHK